MVHFRKSISFIGVMLLIAAASYAYSNAQSTTIEQPKPYILWDVDRVSCDWIGKAPLPPLEAIWDTTGTGRILRNIKHISKGLSGLRFVIGKKREGLGEWYLALSQKYNPHMHAYILQASNGRKQPIQGTIDIIYEVKDANICQFAGSNMGKILLEDLKTRPGFEYIGDCFDWDRSQHVTVEGLKRRVVKPHIEYFTDFLERNQFRACDGIFVDDKIPNVQAARKAGMHAIHFLNPEQLREELHTVLHTEFGIDALNICPLSCPVCFGSEHVTGESKAGVHAV